MREPTTSPELTVTSRQVIAFRLGRSGLRRRTSELLAAMGEVGLTDFPPGAAQAALAPRLKDAAADTRTQAFERRELARMRAMRGAPVVVRAEDVELLAAGMLPADEKSMGAFIGPAMSSVNAAKVSALEAVEPVTREATETLDRGPLDRDTLHAELRRRLPKGLLPGPGRPGRARVHRAAADSPSLERQAEALAARAGLQGGKGTERISWRKQSVQ
ncbi:DNA glycosylase AlkZ-like family protein [Hyalangium gracile]|uniref:DNA glycosylase AlkZ-like family protein n=1 Tax=Hyalangium gracile TaxID=394092 RepID=UPI001CCB6390|nr:crosslink repair DNA glycosylase YcaQ family protein [Hyalangium gracile]